MEVLKRDNNSIETLINKGDWESAMESLRRVGMNRMQRERLITLYKRLYPSQVVTEDRKKSDIYLSLCRGLERKMKSDTY